MNTAELELLNSINANLKRLADAFEMQAIVVATGSRVTPNEANQKRVEAFISERIGSIR